MYRADVTQNLEPAQANIGFAIGAVESKTKAMSQTLGAVGDLYQTKVSMDLKQANVDAEYLSNRFLETNMGAEAAAKAMAPVTSEIDYLQAVGPLSPAEEDVLTRLKRDAMRLQQASTSGMSNVEYENRVSTLAKKTIARYPGLADQIRQSIGAIAGLPGADRWAASQFVASRFSGKSGDDSQSKLRDKLFEDTLTIMSEVTGQYKEDLLNLYNTNRPGFEDVKRSVLDRQKVQAQATLAKKNLEENAIAGNTTAQELRPGTIALFDGFASETTMDTASNMITQGVFNGLLQRAKEGSVDPSQFEVEATMWRTNMLGAINNAQSRAIDAIATLQAEYGFDDATYKSLKQTVVDKYEGRKALWDNDSSFAIAAGAVAKYGKEGYQKAMDAYRVSIQEMGVYGPDVMRTFLLNPERLKSTNPDAFSALSDLFRRRVELGEELSGEPKRTHDNILYNVMLAEKGGQVTQNNTPPSEYKPAVAVVAARGESLLEKALAGTTLTPNEQLLVAEAFRLNATDVDPTALTKRATEIKAKVEKLPEQLKNEVQLAASNGTVQTYAAINSVLNDIEAKYGVRLQLGVNSVGALVPVRPAITLSNRPLMGGVREPIGAVDEFNRQAAYRTMNLVNGTYIAQEGTRSEIATSYADLFNNRADYTGFFTMNAKPTEQPAAESSGNWWEE
jgi:hypothetical protein